MTAVARFKSGGTIYTTFYPTSVARFNGGGILTAVGHFFSEVIAMSDERVYESTRIISEDEVPPDILEKFRQMEASHANTVTKIVSTVDSQNVGALMSAARPNVLEKPSDKKLSERGTALAAQLVNAAKIGEEKRDERILAKAKFLVNNVSRNLKRDADKNVPV